MEFDKKRLKRLFPNLSKELGSEENEVAINSARTEAETGEDAVSKRFVNYTPDVVDFLRRCDTAEQAEEIIAYMEKRGEIDKQYAERLRKQLTTEGIRSFGPKKEDDYYLKHGEI